MLKKKLKHTFIRAGFKEDFSVTQVGDSLLLQEQH